MPGYELLKNTGGVPIKAWIKGVPFDEKAAALTKSREDKAAAEEEWLALEMLREEQESG